MVRDVWHSLFALGFTAFSMSSYSVSQFFVVGVSLFISVLFNPVYDNIPGTQTKFSVRELMIFWGIICSARRAVFYFRRAECSEH